MIHTWWWYLNKKFCYNFWVNSRKNQRKIWRRVSIFRCKNIKISGLKRSKEHDLRKRNCAEYEAVSLSYSFTISQSVGRSQARRPQTAVAKMNKKHRVHPWFSWQSSLFLHIALNVSEAFLCSRESGSQSSLTPSKIELRWAIWFISIKNSCLLKICVLLNMCYVLIHTGQKINIRSHRNRSQWSFDNDRTRSDTSTHGTPEASPSSIDFRGPISDWARNRAPRASLRSTSSTKGPPSKRLDQILSTHECGYRIRTYAKKCARIVCVDNTTLSWVHNKTLSGAHNRPSSYFLLLFGVLKNWIHFTFLSFNHHRKIFCEHQQYFDSPIHNSDKSHEFLCSQTRWEESVGATICF